MKRLFLLMITAVALFAAGCSQEFDDSKIWEEIDSIKSRVSALETVTNAYKNNLFIKSVNQIDNGYIITFSDGSQATVVNTTVNGDNKDDITYIKEVKIGDDEVTFVLTNGDTFSIPMYDTLSITFENESLNGVQPNSTKEIFYIIKSILPDIEVEIFPSADITAKIVPDDESGLTGKIVVQTSATIDEDSKVVVFVSNGEKVIMRRISFEEAGLELEEDAATKEVTAEGGEVTLEFLSNVKYEVVIPAEAQSWISVVPATRAMEKQTITLKLEPNEGAIRSAEVVVKSVDGKLLLTYTITQEPDLDYQLVLERDALIAIYNSLDGDNWTNNENWCSDKPISEWWGVHANTEGCVVAIYLNHNNLSGSIPNDIVNLQKIEKIYLQGNNIYDQIPVSIYSMESLTELALDYNYINGQLSEDIGKLRNLTWLSLGQNYISGKIPCNIGLLKNLSFLDLRGNLFSGSLPESIADILDNKWGANGGPMFGTNLGLRGVIPSSIRNHENWQYYWAGIVHETSLYVTEADIPSPTFSILDLQGNLIDSKELYKTNKVTILYQWMGDAGCHINDYMINLYNQYNSKGLEIIGLHGGRIEIEEWAETVPWPECELSTQKENTILPNCIHYPTHLYPSVVIIDSNQRILYASALYYYNDTINTNSIDKILAPIFGDIDDEYISTDYSTDGDVTTLQTATVGDGIAIVLMGDAYSDRQIADGTYEADMENLYNNLFTEEPYKSFKDHFNVYYVNVVSATEGYEYGDTALDGYFDAGTLVGGNDNAVFSYALNALTEAELDEALLIVAMNSDNYAGTCYMYYPTATVGDYGSGPSVAYFPKGGDATTFAQLLHHEANGHGFAKLADEYAYEYMGEVSSDSVSLIQSQQRDWGWWKNVDFTDDPSAIRWSRFLSDSRYANDGLGAYEGGLTYWTGVWRPTENSIMRYNTGGFNAPSREAIYYRIHKLAYGDSWQYDYEEFVEWDERNIKTAEEAAQAKTWRAPMKVRHTAPPVVVGKSWREAME